MKNVLITGASSGIGYELVLRFAQMGDFKITALARRKDLLLKLEKECKERFDNIIDVHQVDLTQVDKQAIDHIIGNTHYDIVINNAGILINKVFTENTISDIETTFKTNVFAPILIAQSVLNNMSRENKCHIINIGSMGGFQGSVKFPGLSIYSSSKSALANLTECLAEEYANSNVKINCLALGSVQTDMLSEAFPDFKAANSPSEMANFIFDFALKGDQFFNGKVIPVSITTP